MNDVTRGRVRTLFVLSFFQFFFLYSYFHQPIYGANELSRLDVLHAVFHEGRVVIDSYHQNTVDKAIYNESFYSDKAPGLVALAYPSFALTKFCLGQQKAPEYDEASWTLTSWGTCAGSLAIITALGAVAMLAWLQSIVGWKASLVTTFGIYAGSAPFPYSTILFSHGVVVALITCALWLARFTTDVGQDIGERSTPGIARNELPRFGVARLSAYLIGAALGLAIACEYSCGIVALSIAAYVGRLQFSQYFKMLIGAAPFLLLILVNNFLCFGSPLSLGYDHQATFSHMSRGFYGIHFPPSIEAMGYLLFSPAKGLLFWWPIYLLFFFGMWSVARQSNAAFLLFCCLPVLHFVLLAGYSDIKAGSTVGPRYLCASFPLMALACAFGVKQWPRTSLIIVIVSIGITAMATAVDIHFPSRIENPIKKFYIPALKKGQLTLNLGIVSGLRPLPSLLVPFVLGTLGSFCLWRITKRLDSEKPCNR